MIVLGPAAAGPSSLIHRINFVPVVSLYFVEFDTKGSHNLAARSGTTIITFHKSTGSQNAED